MLLFIEQIPRWSILTQTRGATPGGLTRMGPVSLVADLSNRRRRSFQSSPPRRDRGQEKKEDRQRGNGSRDRAGEKDRQGALRDDQALAQRALGQISKHQRKHERRDRVIEFFEHVADDAENKHIPYVKYAVVHGIGADGADAATEGGQDCARHASYSGSRRATRT